MSKISKEFSEALSKAQGEIKHAKLDSKNPHFRSEYASLEAHIDNIKPALAKHGLSLAQGVESKDGQLWLTSRLIFGEEILETGIPLILSKNDMQGLGSAVSYARRYSVAALFNMGSDDDDGNHAVTPPTQYKKTPPPVESTIAMTQPVAAMPSGAGQDNMGKNRPASLPPNEAPQSRVAAYKLTFDFGNVKMGTTFEQLGKEGTEKLRDAVIRYQNSQEKDGKPVSPKSIEFIDLANQFLKG